MDKNITQSALDALLTAMQRYDQVEQKITRPAGIAKSVAKSGIKKGMNALEEVYSLLKNREPQEAFPVATTKEGYILYSDGSFGSSEENNLLRESVLKQYAYTPEAKAYLRTIPIGYTNDEGIGGYFSHNGFGTGTPGIQIHKDMFNSDVYGPYAPADVLAHEFGHAMDHNVAEDSERRSFVSNRDTSRDFYGKLAKNKALPAINRFLDNGYSDADADFESYAEYGKQFGEKAMLTNPNEYKNTYIPMSMEVNQDFQFPSTKMRIHNQGWKPAKTL